MATIYRHATDDKPASLGQRVNGVDYYTDGASLIWGNDDGELLYACPKNGYFVAIPTVHPASGTITYQLRPMSQEEVQRWSRDSGFAALADKLASHYGLAHFIGDVCGLMKTAGLTKDEASLRIVRERPEQVARFLALRIYD